VREDPVRRGLLYAGTEKALWFSLDDGDHWSSLQLNLPHTSMRDLAVHDQDLIVATHGRSFWILDDVSPLRQYSANFSAQEAVLLKPSPAVRAQRSTGTDTPIPPDEPAGRNPPVGAVLDYHLSRQASGAVTIEILDSGGNLVRRAASTDASPFTEEERERELIPAYWIGRPRLPGATLGMHRWIWDLHYAAPRTALRGFPISAVPGETPQEPLGPAAVPGEYRVRLRIGKHSWEQPLRVVDDPRVKATPADYAAQFQLAKRLADALDASTGALLEVRSLRAQIKDFTPPAGGALAGEVRALDQALAEFLSPPPDSGADGRPAEGRPADGRSAVRRGLEGVNGDLATLYGQVTSADAAPTKVQVTAADTAVTDWRPLATEWERLKTQDLAVLNAALRHAGKPALRAELAPPHDPDQADVE
jgi:hypothetical protein